MVPLAGLRLLALVPLFGMNFKLADLKHNFPGALSIRTMLAAVTLSMVNPTACHSHLLVNFVAAVVLIVLVLVVVAATCGCSPGSLKAQERNLSR